MGHSSALQAAIYTRLSTYAPLLAVVTGVYDAVPQAQDSGSAAAFPYVTIGEDNVLPWAQDDAVGAQASIVIHVWSRHRGRSQTKTIQGLIFNALSRHELSISGYNTITVEWDGDQSFMDADGETRHGVSTYRVIMI